MNTNANTNTNANAKLQDILKQIKKALGFCNDMHSEVLNIKLDLESKYNIFFELRHLPEIRNIYSGIFNQSEMKEIMDELVKIDVALAKEISNICDHEFTTDSFDIGFERSKTVCYCIKCEKEMENDNDNEKENV